MEEKIIKDIMSRLLKLEKVVFSNGIKEIEKSGKKKFSGVKGGINFLILQSFFNERRTAPEVRTELRNNKYQYSIQAVQTALNRLSKLKGPLVALKESGKKVYVRRK